MSKRICQLQELDEDEQEREEEEEIHYTDDMTDLDFEELRQQVSAPDSKALELTWHANISDAVCTIASLPCKDVYYIPINVNMSAQQELL